jgi:hypothetical protein
MEVERLKDGKCRKSKDDKVMIELIKIPLPALSNFLATLEPMPPVAPVIMTLFPWKDFM